MRNKAKNALSLAKSISPEMAGTKIGKNSFGEGKGDKIFENLLKRMFLFGDFVIFAVENNNNMTLILKASVS